MKILITGNKGQIATRFFQIYQHTHSIEGFDRENTIDNFDVKSYDAVLHLAALTDIAECENNPKQSKIDNYDLTCEILKRNPKKIIFTSSAAVYGNKYPKLKPISYYGYHKLFSERKLKNHSIVRLSNVFGINKGALYLMKKSNLTNEPFVIYGDTYRDFIHVDDVCYILNQLISSENVLMNVSSNVVTSVKDTAKKYCKNFIQQEPKKEDIIYSRLNNDLMMSLFPMKLKTIEDYL